MTCTIAVAAVGALLLKYALKKLEIEDPPKKKKCLLLRTSRATELNLAARFGCTDDYKTIKNQLVL